MNMVARSSNGERFHLILLRDAAQVRPEPVSKIRGQKRFTVFRTPNTMNEATRERMHNAYFCRPRLDLLFLSHRSPSVETLGYYQPHGVALSAQRRDPITQGPIGTPKPFWALSRPRTM